MPNNNYDPDVSLFSVLCQFIVGLGIGLLMIILMLCGLKTLMT